MAQLLDGASKLGWVLLTAVLRFVFMFFNNCVAIPSYCLYLLLLQPLRIWDSSTFWHIEGIMFKWLLAMVSSWGWIAGYTVTEWGDDVRPISEEEAMVIVNHQSTGDVCTLMMCLQDKGTVVRKMMWLMDHVFKYTNFGLVSLIHGDFFIRQGKAHRDKQLVYLKDHLDKYYHSRDRKWIVLFPEGGFLRKRRETSQLFAKKHSLPHLTHVTLPRLGATHVILKTLSAQQENGSVGSETGTPNQTGNKRKGLHWVIDVTIAYPKARPMDIQTWIFGYRPPTVTHVHYRTAICHSHEREHQNHYCYANSLCSLHAKKLHHMKMHHIASQRKCNIMLVDFKHFRPVLVLSGYDTNKVTLLMSHSSSHNPPHVYVFYKFSP
uniref:Lysophosphatidylglycerol acyltransferase 1 n=1 Tax=Seriola dumerili TaxID=41447 RepID=A0A3B4TDI2_SERDU